jgi:hypothetical protein
MGKGKELPSATHGPYVTKEGPRLYLRQTKQPPHATSDSNATSDSHATSGADTTSGTDATYATYALPYHLPRRGIWRESG